MRKGDIEFRFSKSNALYELVKWQSDTSCYVVAFFRKDKEGYYPETIGERFFEDCDAWIVGKHAIKFLNECFDEEAV